MDAKPARRIKVNISSKFRPRTRFDKIESNALASG